MILTYKIRHGKNLSHELELAKKVAEFALVHKSITSKDVNHIGLKSMIANQILRKYSRNKKLKRISKVNLTVPNQGIQVTNGNIYIPCLELPLKIYFNEDFKKINQIELNKEYAFISVTYTEPKTYESQTFIGVDRNTTHHVIVASDIESGKVLKLGKECNHIHHKYRELRRDAQRKGKFKLVKRIKHRESNIIRDINHKLTSALVAYALKVKGGLVFENLKNIRHTKKTSKANRYSLNSWSTYQQESFADYKAKKNGVPISYVAPFYTSQRCSRCGHIDEANRNGNTFHCTKCGKVEDSGANAGFNIAHLRKFNIPQFTKDSDFVKGNTGIPKGAPLAKLSDSRTPRL